MVVQEKTQHQTKKFHFAFLKTEKKESKKLTQILKNLDVYQKGNGSEKLSISHDDILYK